MKLTRFGQVVVLLIVLAVLWRPLVHWLGAAEVQRPLATLSPADVMVLIALGFILLRQFWICAR